MTARDGAGGRRRSSGGALRGLFGSLAVRCLAVLAAYALALVGVLMGAGALSEAVFEGAFPSMETVLERQGDLSHDRFGALTGGDLSNCLVVVFDSDGRRLYASSREAAEKIRASDLDVIGDASDGLFYEVFEEPAGDGVRHRVMLCGYDAEDDSKVVSSWCVLDESLKVVEGPLFSGRGSLTPREFGLIKGVYDGRMSISRLDYENDGGDPRTLVLAAPIVSDAGYARVADVASRLWLLAVPLVLLLTAAAALALGRLVRRSVRPLDRAIAACRDADARGGAGPVESSRAAGVPAELAVVYDNFRDLMSRLREARDDQRRMVASVSHDLKTPLTVIRGYAQALCEGLVPPDRVDAYHRVIHERALAAADLLEEFSAYARMEHPEHALELVRADVRDLVAASVDEARPLAEQRGCPLETSVGTRGLPALVDEALLRRLLLNLVGNAVEHNPSGTRVRVSCTAEGGRVRVVVADSGVGIPSDLAPHVFEPFVTENTARSTDGGTGLGLTIARRAAELMGGSVGLSTTPEAPWVTEFVVDLPLDAEGEGQPQGTLRNSGNL